MPYKNEFNMKSFFKYIAVAMAMSLLAIGCTPEILAPDQSQLPEASALDVKIDVDQTTNYVTFTVTNPGVVPMWIFGEDKVADGKASKKYAYTQNGLSLRVRDAGTHSVEVKAYNAHVLYQDFVYSNFLGMRYPDNVGTISLYGTYDVNGDLVESLLCGV